MPSGIGLVEVLLMLWIVAFQAAVVLLVVWLVRRSRDHQRRHAPEPPAPQPPQRPRQDSNLRHPA